MKKNFRTIFGLSVLLVGLVALCFGAAFFYRTVRTENECFMLTKDQLTVLSDAPLLDNALHKADDEIAAQIWETILRCSDAGCKLTADGTVTASVKAAGFLDKVNFFTIDWPTVLKHLEENPNIRDVEMNVQLPNAVTVKIYMRIPIAFLNSKNGTYICDDEGMVMPRSQLPLGRETQLPLIVTEPDVHYLPGKPYEKLAGALQLLLLIKPDAGIVPEVIRIRPALYGNQLLLYCTYKPYSEKDKIVALFSETDLERQMIRLVEKLRTDYNHSEIIRDNFLDLTPQRHITGKRINENEIQQLFNPGNPAL